MAKTAQNVVVSGMRPTGQLHLGHWHGVIENWVKLQQNRAAEHYFFVADLHRLTTKAEVHEKIRDLSRDIVLDWLAFGVDPARATIFVQSDVPEHTELHLYLSMITPIGWLERVPSFKDALAALPAQETLPYGFLGYAVLQTADVALYDGTQVPIGADQAAHLEVSREIVRRFNHLFTTDVLTEPQPLFTTAPSLPGSDGRKMSKSYDNGLNLSDAGEVLEKKLLKFMTDPQRVRRSDPGRPEHCPVFAFHKLHTPETERQEVVVGCTTAAMGCVDCKKILFKNMSARLAPHQETRRELEQNPTLVKDILQDGAARARAKARQKIAAVKEVMGL